MAEEASKRAAGANPLALELERAGLALSAAHMGEFEWDLETEQVIISERMAKITGAVAGTSSSQALRTLYDWIHPDDVEAVAQTVRDGLSREGRFEVQYRHVDPRTGRKKWMYAVGASFPDDAGRRNRVVGLVQDIDSWKTEEEAREALVAELDHRVKNVLASVQSLAAQSARKTTSLDAFLKTFAGRLEAMAAAHTLLTATRWRGADISDIAAAELGGLAPGQARWSGPEVILNPRATNALTLALHELATNAVKFGALSSETGRIEVTWTVRPEGGFVLTWQERAGPPVAQPTHRGFGSTLLERVTGRELGGEARMEFRPDGVRVTITANASALAYAGAPAEAAKARWPEAEPETQAGASSGAASTTGIGGLRIIIVEDAMLLSLELEAALIETGAKVVGSAANVEEALQLIHTPFDVAVLDANLNGVSVTPVAEALVARGKRFIIATGYGDAGPAPEGFDAPVVRKPYNVHQIAAAIAEALMRP
jgi:PAS domain S-box-containing protein